MAQCLMAKQGGGADKAALEQITAGPVDILIGKTSIDKNKEIVTGTMPDQGTWNASVGIGGTVTIPEGKHSGQGKVTNNITNRGAWNGTCVINSSVAIPVGYHNGSGKVTNSTPTMAGQTITPTNSQQTVSCSGKYMTGNVVVNGVRVGKMARYTNIEQNTTITGFNFTPDYVLISVDPNTAYSNKWAGFAAGGTLYYNEESGAPGTTGMSMSYNSVYIPNVQGSSGNRCIVIIVGH